MALWRVAFTWTGPSSPLISQLYFDVAGGGTPSQAATAASTFMGAVDAFVSTALTWSMDTEVRQINEETGALQAVNVVTGTNGAGAAAGPRIDLLQGLITWTTGQIVEGRLVRGRMFVPLPTEDHNTATGTPELAGYRSGLDAAATALVGDANSTLVVWSRPVKDEDGVITRAGSQHDVIAGNTEARWSFLSSRRS